MEETSMTDAQVVAIIKAIKELTEEVKRIADAVEIQTMGRIM
jgi:hypothetical protein